MNPGDQSQAVQSGNGACIASPHVFLTILHRARHGMIVIFILTLSGAIAYALLAKPVYRAQVVMMPAQDKDAGGELGALAGQFGGLASLAGINLSLGGSTLDEAITVLKSRAFTEKFIKSRNLLPALFADKWDEKRQQWKMMNPDKIPSLWDATEKFDKSVRRVGHDEGSTIVTLTVDWRDAEAAVEWANGLVADLNDEIRQRAKDEATRSLKHLDQVAARTTEIGVREAAYRLAENQIKTLMLADVRTEYALRVLDPAILPDRDKYIWPKRVLIVAAAIILGLLLAFLYAVVIDAVARLRRQLAAE